jgi:hypothetical protein
VLARRYVAPIETVSSTSSERRSAKRVAASASVKPSTKLTSTKSPSRIVASLFLTVGFLLDLETRADPASEFKHKRQHHCKQYGELQRVVENPSHCPVVLRTEYIAKLGSFKVQNERKIGRLWNHVAE